MTKSVSEAALWTLMWAAVVAAAVYFRPLLPIDETRYLSVAWDMWSRGDFLVPHLNGAPYSHKPPMLFWLINAGWAVFGVNDVWPRLVAPLFGLGCLALTARLAHRLWPGEPMRWLAPLMLIGTFFWGQFTTMTMFDLILCFWVLLGLLGLVGFGANGQYRNIALYGAAVGLGVLTKGPVILVYLLPPALLAPLWRPADSPVPWRRWFAACGLGLALGVGIALAWAIPAGISGGAAYRNAIFWGQSAGRMVDAFDHGKPVWWYLAVLPLMILPWIVWPTLWRGAWDGLVRRFRRNGGTPRDAGLRLAAVWAVSAFVIFSLISGKRPHYLLPMFPALAMIAAILVVRGQSVSHRWDLMLPAIPALVLGAAVLVVPFLGGRFGLPDWVGIIQIWWAAPLLLTGAWLVLRPPERVPSRALAIATMGVVVVVSVQGVAAPRLHGAYDLRPVAALVARAQKNGWTVANYGKYHGQFNFLGRLTAPVTELGNSDIAAWLAEHPNTKIVAYYDNKPMGVPGGGAAADFVHPFRNGWVAVWDGDVIREHPELARRGAY